MSSLPPHDPNAPLVAPNADDSMEIPTEMVGTQDPDEAFAGYLSRSKKKKKFHLPGDDVSGLNLTAMMDMMTILLVFLLKSYATEPDKFQVNDKMRPPTSTIEEHMDPAIQVVVTSEEILVDDDRIMSVADVNTTGTGQQLAITPVFEALSKKVDHLKKLESLGGPPFDGKLLIIAHEGTPYALISAVLYTAGQAQLSRFRLVVMDDGKDG
jgi:biopolymer transport protein ExbD